MYELCNIDAQYCNLVDQVLHYGEKVGTRNHATFRADIGQSRFLCSDFPLVTVRKTAAKKALLEMEWFLSGNSKCPAELSDWWEDQLSVNQYTDNHYRCGYGYQLRRSPGSTCRIDQISDLLRQLRFSPNSRRMILTTWNPSDMANIGDINNNTKTPSCCHMSMMQFQVSQGKLHCFDYQRSGDLMLGVPHNLVQHWALLVYLAHHSDLEVGALTWTGGDVHIYDDPSHTDVASAISNLTNFYAIKGIDVPQLKYNYSGEIDKEFLTPTFKASDFSIEGLDIWEPKVTGTRPILF